MTDDRLQEIKKRLEDEPSGTWDICPWPDRLEISPLGDGPACDVRTARFLSHVRIDMEDLIEEVERLRATPAMVEWRHLDGTVCVAGWDAGTGQCSEGGGPVTPRLEAPAAAPL